MVAIVLGAVATGEYASSSEVVRDALRDWTHQRSLHQQGVAELRQVWRDARLDKRPGVSADDVLDRLERKYQAMVDAGSADRHRRGRPHGHLGNDAILFRIDGTIVRIERVVYAGRDLSGVFEGSSEP
jgi:antitoxin ParD1/3/4